MGTGTGTDFQTWGHTTPITMVSWVFAVLQAHPLSKELLGIFHVFSYFFFFFMIFLNKISKKDNFDGRCSAGIVKVE